LAQIERLKKKQNETDLFAAYCSVFLIACAVSVGQTHHQVSANSPQEYTFTIVRMFPHDSSAFTQGLAYRDGFLYEGTGLNGRSSLRKVRLETGEVVQRVDVGSEFFGEGITLVKRKSSPAYVEIRNRFYTI